jgi:hypothetical protein
MTFLSIYSRRGPTRRGDAVPGEHTASLLATPQRDASTMASAVARG